MAIGIESTAQQEKNQQHLVADYIWETGRQRSQVWIGRWGKQCCCERNYKIKLHGIKEIKIWPILTWCEFIDFFLKMIGDSERERNHVIVFFFFSQMSINWWMFIIYFYWSKNFNGWRAKIFIKIYARLAIFYGAESILCGPPPKKNSVIITIACKYLLFITACLENGIRKKPSFSFWLSHDLDFPLQFKQKSDWDFRNEPRHGNT